MAERKVKDDSVRAKNKAENQDEENAGFESNGIWGQTSVTL